MDELRTKCWQTRVKGLGSMSLLKTRLGRFSMFPELGSSKGQALWDVTLLSSSSYREQKRGPSSGMELYSSSAKTRFCHCCNHWRPQELWWTGEAGIVLEPSAMPSPDPSIATHFYFHILKPLGPAPKFCVQMPFPPTVSERPGPNHGSQAGQDTAGRDTFSGKGDLIQTHCLMGMLLSVTSQDNTKGTHIPKTSL